MITNLFKNSRMRRSQRTKKKYVPNLNGHLVSTPHSHNITQYQIYFVSGWKLSTTLVGWIEFGFIIERNKKQQLISMMALAWFIFRINLLSSMAFDISFVFQFESFKITRLNAEKSNHFHFTNGNKYQHEISVSWAVEKDLNPNKITKIYVYHLVHKRQNKWRVRTLTL